MNLRSAFRLLPGMVFLAGLGIGGAMAQDAAASPPPDPAHIPFFPTPLELPKNIQWKGDPAKGQLNFSLFGDSSKPGLYGGLIKWLPGFTSMPHFHDQMRYAYVVSGTWWVSSSNTHDLSTLYPMHAGSFVTDIANTVHWDGAKAGDEPAVILLVGMGPVTTRLVDEQGKPLQPDAAKAAGH